MQLKTRHPDGAQSRSFTWIAGAALLLIVASAITFARGDQSVRVAVDAATITTAEQTLSAAATYRASVIIAVVAAATDPRSAISAQASASADESLWNLLKVADQVEDRSVGEAVSMIEGRHSMITGHLADGELDRADEVVASEILPLLDSVTSELHSISAAGMSRIAAERASAGRTARASSFVVALIAPAFGLWAVRQASRRKMEREILAAELANQREVAAVQERLISGMSHQLRTPLTGIYGFAEALLEDSAGGAPDPGLVQEGSRTILGEANRLRAMVDDILITARAQSDDLAFDQRPFDVRAEIEAAVDPFRRMGSDVDVVCGDYTLVGDRLRLRHVLRNLVDNALRHGQHPVRLITERAGGFEIAVEDAGEGPDDDGNLFEPFASDQALVSGSLGLGLSVCRTICDGMGVELRYERTEGVTRFVLGWLDEVPVETTPLSVTRT